MHGAEKSACRHPLHPVLELLRERDVKTVDGRIWVRHGVRVVRHAIMQACSLGRRRQQ